MELRTLATFRTAAATLSFTQTAAALGYVQSSVTAQIQQLERELGVALFDRFGNRLALTEAGRRLLAYADRLLMLADEARAAVGQEVPAGTLTFSGPESVVSHILPSILTRYRAAHPTVRVRFTPTPYCDIKRRVHDGQLDVGFVLEEPVSPGTLSVAHLRPVPLATIAAPTHPLAARKRVTAADLAGEQVLFTEVGCPYRNKFEHALIAAGAHPGPLGQDFTSVDAIKKCVAAGLGVAALPRMVVEQELRSGALAALAWVDETIIVHTQMIWSATRWMSPALEAFIEVVRSKPWEAGGDAAEERRRASRKATSPAMRNGHSGKKRV